ncbi:MAG: DUF4398 domain-containing protein [Haloarculaceae archaeon]
MSWSRSSEAGVALLLIVLVAAVATPVGAVTVGTKDVPEKARAGSTVTATFNVTDLYEGRSDNWTLTGRTELEQATWTIKRIDQTGKQIGDTREVTGPTFEQSIDASTGVSKVVVSIEGRVPESAAAFNFSYDPPQELLVAGFRGGQQGGIMDGIRNVTTRPYTADSIAARRAIRNASDVIQQVEQGGANPTQARQLLQSAISVYDEGSFTEAIDLAQQAKSQAKSAQASAQQQNLLLFIGGGVVILGLLAVGVYLYLQRRQTYDKLG